MRRSRLLAALLSGAALALAATSAQAATAAPKLQSPADGATVEAMPPLKWSKVKGADVYEVEIAADPRFGSLVDGRPARTGNTAYTRTVTIADGDYFWRVRGLTAKGRAGKWSAVHRLRKAWSQRPDLQSAVGEVRLLQPSQPVVLRWSPVGGAVKYLVQVATDPSLATSAIDDNGRGVETSASAYAIPGTLAPGKYHWVVTPIDAQGHRGARSAVGAFVSDWPAATTGTVTDLNADPRVFDPELSWQPVAGAVAYDVEVNYSQDFAIGSKVCCGTRSTGTTVSPTALLANNTYYWRVRAIDASGNAGAWNSGESFRKVFDDVTPTVPGLRMRDNLADPAVDTEPAVAGLDLEHPVVRWDPVAGASSYEIQITPFTTGCDWGKRVVSQITTATTWVARALPAVARPGPAAWPTPSADSVQFVEGGSYCARVNALSSDSVVSEWSQIGGANQPAFTYRKPAAAVTGNPVMTAGDYTGPAAGGVLPRSPLLTWKRVPTADSYWVVIARDQAFTTVTEVGFTRTAAYSLRNPLEDETTSYYWVVIPAKAADGGGVFSEYSDNAPQSFQKRSTPPGQVAPDDAADIVGTPRFAWTAAEGAVDYRLQVAADPSFNVPIADVVTAASSYTATDTYPVDTALYWRVRANASKNVGLTWSPTRTFRRRLPAPSLAPDNPLGGGSIPVLSWSPVQGAESYDLHVEQADGTRKDFTVRSTSFTPTAFYGSGVWRWQVRAIFPGRPATPGPYSPQIAFTRSIPALGEVKAEHASGRMLLRWSAVPGAKRYRVEIAGTTGFVQPIQAETTDHTAWAPDLSLPDYRRGGKLHWRVAAVDEGNNLGAFSSSTVKVGRRLVVTASGLVRRRQSSQVAIRVADAANGDVKGARITLAGAGVRLARKAAGTGSLVLIIKPRRRGTIVVKATRKGYRAGSTRLRVR